MKGISALFLQVVVVLIGIGTLGLMLWEPHLEGRNAHATVFEIYFKDPFLAYVYVGSIPFFVALHRAFGMLGHIRRHQAYSQATVSALRAIRRCGLILTGFVAGGAIFIIAFGDKEDRPPGIFMSALAFLVATAIATTATMSARYVQRALRRSDGSQS